MDAIFIQRTTNPVEIEPTIWLQGWQVMRIDEDTNPVHVLVGWRVDPRHRRVSSPIVRFESGAFITSTGRKYVLIGDPEKSIENALMISTDGRNRAASDRTDLFFAALGGASDPNDLLHGNPDHA